MTEAVVSVSPSQISTFRQCKRRWAWGAIAKIRELAALFNPALIICGGSAYSREWDYKEFRSIADENGSLLMMDMAHISGLVAAGEAASPFEHSDVVRAGVRVG